MKVVVAPDVFSGTPSAAEAATPIAPGWHSARPLDELVLVPMADAGEGTIEVVEAAAAGAQRHEAEVVDARGRTTVAAWLSFRTAARSSSPHRPAGFRN